LIAAAGDFDVGRQGALFVFGDFAGRGAAEGRLPLEFLNVLLEAAEFSGAAGELSGDPLLNEQAADDDRGGSRR
jgi:hypothetical protein